MGIHVDKSQTDGRHNRRTTKKAGTDNFCKTRTGGRKRRRAKKFQILFVEYQPDTARRRLTPDTGA
jgi:hypothetical protein